MPFPPPLPRAPATLLGGGRQSLSPDPSPGPAAGLSFLHTPPPHLIAPRCLRCPLARCLLVPHSLEVVRFLAWSPGVEHKGELAGNEGAISLDENCSPRSPGVGVGNYNSHQLSGPELQLPAAPRPSTLLVTPRGDLCWILNPPQAQSQGLVWCSGPKGAQRGDCQGCQTKAGS